MDLAFNLKLLLFYRYNAIFKILDFLSQNFGFFEVSPCYSSKEYNTTTNNYICVFANIHH